MNENVIYRRITPEELDPGFLDGFRRRQQVTKCWRKVDGAWQLWDNAFVEDWSAEDRGFVLWCLQEILATGGAVFGAFTQGGVKGIAAVKPEPFGSRGQYRELAGLWVSQELRGCGIGGRLFSMAKTAVRAFDGEKLFVSSHPSQETQAFYRAMGCVEAEESSSPHAEYGPFDCQIECRV